ncbi:MAG TPA: glycosyltransferase family 2 protein [Solirubrobacteraceae bacterium]
MSPGAPIAVAIVSWNTRDLLRANLEALRPDADAGRAQVWVVDNRSEDGSPDMVAAEFGWVHLLQPGENLGFGRAVNRVAAQTDSEWIAAANADLAVRPGALEALLAAGKADPGAGVMGPKLLLPDGSVQRSVQPFYTLTNALLRALHLHARSARIGRRLCFAEHWDPDRGGRVDWVAGALLLIRRRTWEDVGGFDEAQWMYAEDLDLCWRAARAGWATRYVPEAVVRHEHGAAAAQAFGDTVDKRWLVATYAWLAQRRGILVAWAVAGVNALDALARLAVSRPGPKRAVLRGHLDSHLAGLRSRRALERAR